MENMRQRAEHLADMLEAAHGEFLRIIGLIEEVESRLVALDRVLEGEAMAKGAKLNQSVAALHEHLEALGSLCTHARQENLGHLQEAAQQLHGEMNRCASLAELGALSASVAHEIRNPLCGIMFSLEVLRTKMDEDDSRLVIVNNVRREAERMEKVVQNLLHFARSHEPALAPCELESVVQSSLETIRSHLKKKNLTVHVENSARDGHANVDRELVQQVFGNLLMNAADASPQNGKLVIRVLDLDEGQVGVAFQDEGEGVRPEETERIFEPFYTSKRAGVGLGLAVSKKIVEAHGGRIVVESKPGSGSTFTVVFPRK